MSSRDTSPFVEFDLTDRRVVTTLHEVVNNLNGRDREVMQFRLPTSDRMFYTLEETARGTRIAVAEIQAIEQKVVRELNKRGIPKKVIR